MKVYVSLLEEGTPCWRPVEANHVKNDVYSLVGTIPEDKAWEFEPGDLVRCSIRKDSAGQEFLAAVEKAIDQP